MFLIELLYLTFYSIAGETPGYLSGSLLSLQDKDGNTPLHAAVLSGENKVKCNILYDPFFTNHYSDWKV